MAQAEIFENDRTYPLGSPELEILGTRDLLAQWRHRNYGPAFFRIGRKICYAGKDLYAWLDAQRQDPSREVVAEIRTSC